MSILTISHIFLGTLAIISGTVALIVKKGSKFHIRSGKIFVISMIPMALTGAWLAWFIPERITVIAGVLTAYLVITSLISAKSKTGIIPKYNWFAFIVISVTAIASISIGAQAQFSGNGLADEFPAIAYYVFGGIAAMAALFDLIVIRSNGVRGKHRIARHLWRMCFALLIAVTSFFLGQEQVFPEALQGTILLALPVIFTLCALIFWSAKILYFSKR